MPKATLRFYQELNDHLPEEKRQTDFVVRFDEKTSIGTLVKGLGVPEEEIDLVLLNGQSVGLDHPLQEGDRASIYPVFETLNIQGVASVRENPLRELKLIAEIGLGETASYLMSLGYDVIYNPSLSPGELITLADREKRIILTRNKNLLRLDEVHRAVFLPSGTPRDHEARIESVLDPSGD
jgi:uncharacterized protein